MRKTFLATTLALAAFGSGCSKTDTSEASPKADKDKAGPTEAKIPELTPDEVEKGIASRELTAADCNHDALRKKLGVVPGAIIITDLDGFPASQLPADKTAKLVFYCADPG